MQLCSGRSRSDSHDEICHADGGCPLCEAMERVDEAVTAKETVERERDDLVTEAETTEGNMRLSLEGVTQEVKVAREERDEFEGECSELRSKLGGLEQDNGLLQDEVERLGAANLTLKEEKG